MASLIKKREETYYTYTLDSKERELLATLLYVIKDQLKDDKSYKETLDELLRVFCEE